MRTTLAFTALLASWTVAVAASPFSQFGKSGYIAKETTQVGHSDNDTKEVVILGDDEDLLDLKEELTKLGGVAIKIGTHCVDALNAMDQVKFVEEKVDVQTFVETKTNAPWGLQRISNKAGASGDPQTPDFTYSFDDPTLGTGVDIYIVDTGVFGQHAIFNTTDGKSRVEEGVSFTGSTVDGDGHGTHVAGTAGGARFGVGQGVNIIPVKVLGDDGSGSSADTIAGMDWVITRHNQRKTQDGFKGSVMSMSWGLAGVASTVDEVVKKASAAGIHISVAAGNDGVDACTSTPALNGGANSDVVTVGSIDIQNAVSTFSNIGKCVDIYAPGEQILSSWNTGANVLNFLSGTSMATPHVSGVMAYLLAQDTSLATDTAGLKSKLKSLALSSAITGSTGGGPSILLNNGVDGGVAAKLKRTATGSPAAWARSAASALGMRWKVHSRDAALRF
ncbi:subtilisin-like protein [Lophiostoma macrostomum CBS 122681]|uniref:Subtilisin-like protein n=1 Tax=Lophiostoma macrostomum CBS 122681 TaxID=1314788 RepID=A0A6A6T4L7_9PLEO|nr:subtilisin-like protein [Lophiostoma macrostomum CBS 122681]